MSKPRVEYQGEVWQNGMRAAAVNGRSRKAVERETYHYALMYGQDGPVDVRIKRKLRRKTK